ncbi:IS66 family transposase [Reinekea marinisedimentorum]|uniref:Transposase n=1 Tax=Reinekea marinisedimentorum TaxID=230495 RepID=A0A4R3HQ48_9GAMM|nr:IS66 family transposase [Reinekea marinisedimentorum]TCS34307.1 transposase [Reinekea marinisedimentorum]
MTHTLNLDKLNEQQLRALAAQLLVDGQKKDATIKYVTTENQQLKHEMAILKRHKFARTSEVLNAHQRSLLDDLVNEDIAAIEEHIAQHDAQLAEVQNKPQEKRQPKRAPLPPELPRTIIEHEPHSTECSCGCQLKRIGEDISEKLDYVPGTFTVERHVRGKWVCDQCETLTQAPVPAQIIDKGIPTAGLLAQVLIAKYGDHLPLYRQEKIFARAGVEMSRSTLADWVGRCGVALQPIVDALRDELHQHSVLHADETPVAMLSPGKQKTHKAYVWAYTSTPFSGTRAVVYDFAPGRSGEHARRFLQSWQGKLVCDDFSGYKASFKQGITEIGCMAHARRKFFDLHAANQSTLAEYALQQIGHLYDIEREIKETTNEQRKMVRQQQAKPILDQLREWLTLQRQRVPNGSAIAKAIDYSLKRWDALTRYCEDGAVPIDNNWVENQIRPWALGRNNWLFAGSLRSGQRAANVMSLIQSAKLNGHDPYMYLKDVLARLPSQKNNQLDELLPHNWAQPDKV